MIHLFGQARSAPSGATLPGVHGRQRTAQAEMLGRFFHALRTPGLLLGFRGSDCPSGKLELPTKSLPVAAFSLKFPPVNSSAFVNSVSDDFPGQFLSARKARALPRLSNAHRDNTILEHRVIAGRLFTAYPAERNKTCVILLRSLARIKSLGWLPSEPLCSPLATALRARLRDGAHSQQNTGCCFVRLSDPNSLLSDDA